MKRTLIGLAIALGLFVSKGFAANDVFLANTALGANTGANCANALVFTYFNNVANWSATPSGILIGPATTVHLCGLIVGTAGSPILTFQGAGTSGSPITMKWETGASLTSPYCGSTGCVYTGGSNNAYLIFDGNCVTGGKSPGVSGIPCVPASITNTGNGSPPLGNNASGGIGTTNPQSCNNCEYKNLTLTHFYDHTSFNDNTPVQQGACVQVLGSNWSFHDNYCQDTGTGVSAPYGVGAGGNDSGGTVFNNTFHRINHHIEMGAANGTNAHLSAVTIHDNHFKDSINWDDANFNNHHNHVMMYGLASCGTLNTMANIKVYNNLMDGDMGIHATSNIFIFCGMNGVYVFNNVLSNLAQEGYQMISQGVTPVAETNSWVINNFFDCGGAIGNRQSSVSATGLIWANNAMRNCGIYWSSPGGPPTITTLDYNVFGADILNGSTMAWDDNGGAYAFNNGVAGATYVPTFVCPPFSNNAANNGGFMTGNGSLTSGGTICLDSHSVIAPLSGLGVDVNARPLGGSVLIHAGTNLTYLTVSTIPELASDKAGLARPSSGTWDAGAFQGEVAVTCTRPVISSLSSNGTPYYLTITGTNFGPAPVDSTVTVGGILAYPLSWSATSIQIPIPGNALTGNVVVTVCNQASVGVPITITRQ